jgi:hypothetical protein
VVVGYLWVWSGASHVFGSGVLWYGPVACRVMTLRIVHQVSHSAGTALVMCANSTVVTVVWIILVGGGVLYSLRGSAGSTLLTTNHMVGGLSPC